MSAYVIVQWGPHAPSARATDSRIARVLRRHHAVVLPAPGAAAEADTSTISVPDMARADALASTLRTIDGVESAYAKPGEELP